MLQVSQHEKSVWHALLALGSLHESFEKKGQDKYGVEFLRHEQDAFAIREYSAAIKALLAPSDIKVNKHIHSTPAVSFGNVTVDVCLISCILFTCFEVSPILPFLATASELLSANQSLYA